MSHAYLGVDAGNSKTVAIVATADGRIVGRGRGGTGDIYREGGADGALREVRNAVGAALAAAGTAATAVRSAAFLLAGVDWPEDGELWRHAIRTELPGLDRVSVRNDGFALLRLGSESGIGVSVLAGTGAAIAARGQDGAELSMSFWIQDDLGAIGLGGSAVRAVVRADLGLDGPTELEPALLQHFGEREVPDLLHSFTRRVAPRSRWERATASRPVLAAAAAGDAVARAIVQEQAARLAEYGAAAARRVGLADDSPVPVSLGGGLVAAAHHIYRDGLIDAVRALLPRAVVTVVQEAPVLGAVLEALAEDGRSVGPEVRRRLGSDAHPADFLLT